MAMSPALLLVVLLLLPAPAAAAARPQRRRLTLSQYDQVRAEVNGSLSVATLQVNFPLRPSDPWISYQDHPPTYAARIAPRRPLVFVPG